MTTTTDDPLAPASAQFPLVRPDTAPASWDDPSPVGVRPWGLRRMGPVLVPSARWLAWGYDHDRQLATDPLGSPSSTSLPARRPRRQPRGVDGEDPPSSEDWINDYAPDEPFQP